MPGQIELLNKLESCVNIENVTLQLLVNSIARTSESSSLLDMVMHHHSYTELFVCGSGEIIIDSQDGPSAWDPEMPPSFPLIFSTANALTILMPNG